MDHDGDPLPGGTSDCATRLIEALAAGTSKAA